MALALVGALGCGRGRSAPPEPTSGDAPRSGGDNVSSSAAASHQWSRHPVDELGLTVDVLADLAVSTGAAGGIHYLIQSHGPLKLGLWWGPGRNLEAWRGFYGPPRAIALGPETAITVCGVAARGQTGEVEAGPDATGLVPGDDGKVGHLPSPQPALRSNALAFELNGTPVLAEWAVEREAGPEWAAAGAHFFESIACTAR